MDQSQRSLRVLIRQVDFGEHRVFVAQCLEFNIAAQGDTPQDAQNAFVESLIQTHALVALHGAEDPFEYLGSAPPEVFEAWGEAFKGNPERVPFDNGILVEPALAYAS